jgi:hypothetical protein
MATTISNAAAIAACNAVVDLIDAGSAAGYVNIYQGTQPTNPDAGIGGSTLLATALCSDPAFGAAADAAPGGRATAAAIAGVVATGTGNINWFRVFDDNDVAIIDGSAGTSGADMIVSAASITAGQTFDIDTWTITMPET